MDDFPLFSEKENVCDFVFVIMNAKTLLKMGLLLKEITQQAHNVETTSIQRQDVESTLNLCCFNGCASWVICS